MARSVAESVRLQPADPFDLIRLLAQSQSDPRKAVAELVQNSIDASKIDATPSGISPRTSGIRKSTGIRRRSAVNL
jgi:hypothetical protein